MFAAAGGTGTFAGSAVTLAGTTIISVATAAIPTATFTSTIAAGFASLALRSVGMTCHRLGARTFGVAEVGRAFGFLFATLFEAVLRLLGLLVFKFVALSRFVGVVLILLEEILLEIVFLVDRCVRPGQVINAHLAEHRTEVSSIFQRFLLLRLVVMSLDGGKDVVLLVVHHLFFKDAGAGSKPRNGLVGRYNVRSDRGCGVLRTLRGGCCGNQFLRGQGRGFGVHITSWED